MSLRTRLEKLEKAARPNGERITEVEICIIDPTGGEAIVERWDCTTSPWTPLPIDSGSISKKKGS